MGVDDHQLLGTVEAHAREVRHAAFRPDGARFVTAGHDGRVCLWALPRDRRPAAELERPCSAR